MQTNVTQTSLFSYYTFVKDLSEMTQGEKIKHYMKEGNKTINSLSRVTGMECGKVSARLNMLKEKKEVYKTGNKITDPVTGLPNEEWDIIETKNNI